MMIPRQNTEQRNEKRVSVWIGNVMIDADWDDDGQIDYEEFLRALHPRFNEAPVTPTAMNSLPPEQADEVKMFDFPNITRAATIKEDQSLAMDPDDETGKVLMNRFMKNKSNKQAKSAAELPSKSRGSSSNAMNGAVINKKDTDDLEADTVALEEMQSLTATKSYEETQKRESKEMNTGNISNEPRAQSENFDDLTTSNIENINVTMSE